MIKFFTGRFQLATLFLALLLSANTAYAITGSKVYEACSDKPSKLFCDGIIWGAAEGLQVMNRISFQLYPKMFYEKLYCIPKEAPPQETS